MKKIFIILLLSMLIAGCAGQSYEGVVQYQIQLSPVHIVVDEITLAPTMVVPSPTIVVTPTLTPLPTATLVPTLTPTLKPTLTSTLVPTLTPTLIPTVIAQPGTLYVSLEGNNANDGSLNAPFRTIQQAVNKAKPGDVIYVRGGTYSEYVVISASGTAGAPIILSSYPGEEAILDGGSSIALRSSGVVAYWTIQNMTIKSTNRYTTRFGWWGEVGVHDIAFKNNKINGSNLVLGYNNLYENNDVSGIGYTASNGDAGLMEISTSHNNTFRNNNVHDFTKYNARGIWSQGLTHDSLFENNTVTNIWSTSGGLGQCINLDGAGNVEWRHIVRNNVINGCSYVGIQLENGFEHQVYGNKIDSEGSAGIIIISYDSKVGCKVGGENNQYGDTNGDGTCKGEATNNQIIGNTITTQDYWGYGYAGIKDWDTAVMVIQDNILTAGQWNTNYPAISVDGDTPDMVRDVQLINNTILTE
jgi:hypothetical protein